MLLCPAAPTVAVPHDPEHAWHERQLDRERTHDVAAPIRPSGAPISTVASICPPRSRPPASRTGLPVGVQIIGPEYGDLHLHRRRTPARARHFQGFVPPKGWDADDARPRKSSAPDHRTRVRLRARATAVERHPCPSSRRSGESTASSIVVHDSRRRRLRLRAWRRPVASCGSISRSSPRPMSDAGEAARLRPCSATSPP